jgi:hypothetical protein
MQRNHWHFRFVAKDLAAAARKKAEHHRNRFKFWEDAKAKVMAEVKETGIEVSESEAGATYSNTGRGFGPQVMVRNDLQKRLTECHQKIIEHNQRVTEYGGWVEVLDGSPSAELMLDSDDYLFFFGG